MVETTTGNRLNSGYLEGPKTGGCFSLHFGLFSHPTGILAISWSDFGGALPISLSVLSFFCKGFGS